MDPLKPGFSSSDLELALRSQSDSDLALALFRWSQSSSSSCHRHPLLPTSPSSLSSSTPATESILHQVLSDACCPDLPILNLLIDFSSSHRHLFSPAFDLYNLLIKKSKSKDENSSIRPDLTTYKILLTTLLCCFGKPPVSYIYLHSLRSFVRQMKAFAKWARK